MSVTFEWQTIESTRISCFDTGVTLSLGQSEQERSRAQQALCTALETRTGWHWEITDVWSLSRGENISEDLKRYGMPISAAVPPLELDASVWTQKNSLSVHPRETARMYLYDSGLGVMSISASFTSPAALDTLALNPFLIEFIDAESPCHYPKVVWRVIHTFREIIQTPPWSSCEVSHLSRSEHFTRATEQVPIYFTYATCTLDNLWGAAHETDLQKYLANWLSDSFNGGLEVNFVPLAEGLQTGIAWGETLILRRVGAASPDMNVMILGQDVVRLVELMFYFWFLLFVTDSLLNREVRQMEITRSEDDVRRGIAQLRAFRAHTWRTIDSFRFFKASFSPLYVVVLETTRLAWRLGEFEQSINEKLQFLDTLHVDMNNVLQAQNQTRLNNIALAFTVITFVSAAAGVLTAVDYDNSKSMWLAQVLQLRSAHWARALILVMSLVLSVGGSWLYLTWAKRRKQLE